MRKENFDVVARPEGVYLPFMDSALVSLTSSEGARKTAAAPPLVANLGDR